jgi:uncharacterized membrane protein
MMMSIITMMTMMRVAVMVVVRVVVVTMIMMVTNNGDSVHCYNNDKNDNQIMNKNNKILQISYH